MSDMSDDEELQRLREAALKSKRRIVSSKAEKNGIETINEVHRISPSLRQPQVPTTLPLHMPENWNSLVQPQTMFRPYFIQQPVAHPQILIRLPQTQNLPMSLPMPHLNNIHFPNFPQPYTTLSPMPGPAIETGNCLSRVAPTSQRMQAHSLMQNASSSEFKQSVGAMSSHRSNLIVITNSEVEPTAVSSSSSQLPTSSALPIETITKVSHQRPTKKKESSGTTSVSTIVRPQDKWTSNKSDVAAQDKSEKVRRSKFKRYDDDSTDEEDDYESQTSSPEPEHHPIREPSECTRMGNISINSEEKVFQYLCSESKEKTIEASAKETHHLEPSHTSCDQNPEKHKSLEAPDDRDKFSPGLSSSHRSSPCFSTSSNLPPSSKSPENKQRFLSFSDDAEDLHLDIPDFTAKETASMTQSDGNKTEKETIAKSSCGRVVIEKSVQNGTSSKTAAISKEVLKSKSREKRIDIIDKKLKSVKHSSKTKKPKNEETNCKSHARCNDHGKKEERISQSRRKSAESKRKFEEIRSDDCYDVVRERTYKKSRYSVLERNLLEYRDGHLSDFSDGGQRYHRDYALQFADFRRQSDKKEPHSVKETVSDGRYYYGDDERMSHAEYRERSRDDYYREYYDMHRMNHNDEEHYHHSSPQRYRAVERDYFEADLSRAEPSRKFDENYYSDRDRVGPVREYSSKPPIPSLLDGLVLTNEMNKKHVTDGTREKHRSIKSTVMSSIIKPDHSKGVQFLTRDEEGYYVNSKFNRRSADVDRDSEREERKKCVEEFSDKKFRKVIKSRADVETGKKSRNMQESTTSVLLPNGDGNSKVEEPKEGKHKGSIHHRLGSKPEKKNSAPSKKTEGSDLRNRLACRQRGPLLTR